ncbi:MAG: M36 family metallopeptidase [Acidobacteriota bacterium]
MRPIPSRRMLCAPPSVALVFALCLLSLSPPVTAAGPHAHVHDGGELLVVPRDFDARVEIQDGLRVAPTPRQQAAVDSLRAALPEVSARMDNAQGTLRTLSNPTGYLTASAPSEATPLSIGLSYVEAHLEAFGLVSQDLADYEISDLVESSVSGATHVYLLQRHAGLPVVNGQLYFNVNRDGRLLSVNNAFAPELSKTSGSTTPRISATAAVAHAAEHLDLDPQAFVISTADDPRRTTGVEAPTLSLEPIEATLWWLPVQRGKVRLVWRFLAFVPGDQHVFDFTVDAEDGRIWTRWDLVESAEYRVYEQPIESPQHTTPAPPADARTVAVDPQGAPSPFGWHDTDGSAGAEFTIHRGNNVHAYDDRNGSNGPPGTEPDCGPDLECDFPIDLTQAPGTYIDAAVTNLFYWNNIIHDIQYLYGFDEVAGNFQVNNYGNGGSGGDDVRAEAQDGGGNCNANMLTLPDGQRPRMQMFTCTNASPTRDGDLDAAVIVHEYGHGISIRQVGGPSNTGCLNTTQQPGEGWSDWWGLVYTAEAGDVGTESRGMATWLFGQAPDGPGIRPQPYSTDPAVNSYTYESIDGLSVPHGVGSVWAQAAWEAYWALVDEHGFDADLADPGPGAGNHRAMLYINEGLKSTACGPSFLDVRDGVIQAAIDNYGGDDVCLLWDTFAAFGLGTDAVSTTPNTSSVTNGFDTPLECQCTVPAVASTLTATVNGDNQIDLAWTASPTADVTYNVYRAFGGCPASGAELLASGVAGNSYSDLTASGGTEYSYYVTVSDLTGVCESEPTNCDSATGTGACIRPPTFDGLVTASNPGANSCTAHLDWDDATGHCGDDVTYNVYRSLTPDFDPGPGNLLAECVTGSDYSDTDVEDLQTYHYIVRAEDNVNVPMEGGCGDGNEDLNEVEASVLVTGPDAVYLEDDVEDGPGDWATDAGTADTGTTAWAISDSDSNSASNSWFVPENTVVTDQRLASIIDVDIPAGSPAELHFWHRYNTEQTYDGGVLEYSTDGGTTWQDILAGDGGTIAANANRFVEGEYDLTLSTCCGNPLPGRDAWSGDNNTWTRVIVSLADFGDTPTRLRWRFGNDSSITDTGWWVDDVRVFYTLSCSIDDPVVLFGDGFETGTTVNWTTFVTGGP